MTAQKRVKRKNRLWMDMVRLAWSCNACGGVGHTFGGGGCWACHSCKPLRDIIRAHYGYDHPMDMDTPSGSKVRYLNPFNGWDGDKQAARERLKLGGIYVVEGIEIGSSHTSVWLVDAGGPWNHVLFANSGAA